MTQLNLEGRTNLDISLALLRHYEPPEGYWLAFSGGKDSQVVLELAKMAGVKYEARYSVTTIDPPEVLRFMKEQYPEVVWDYPKRGFRAGMAHKGMPTRRGRWCCEELKHKVGKGRRVVLGVRSSESPRRAKQPVAHRCPEMPAEMVLSPIREWSDDEVWVFHQDRGLPHCRLYDEGWDRIGCVVCPFESHVAESMARWPMVWESVRRAYHRWWDTHDLTRQGEQYEAKLRWKTADDAFAWFCSRDEPYPARMGEEVEDEQPAMFV